jgi:divalent metal cation (Fe/Co/Zn/Cd) transporter
MLMQLSNDTLPPHPPNRHRPSYHSGPRLIVEVDIVMDPQETLRATHDVAEELQIKLESLPDVERAYVHVDYETDHRPEHFLKKEL